MTSKTKIRKSAPNLPEKKPEKFDRSAVKFITNDKGVSPASGSKSIDFTHVLANQALQTLWASPDKDQQDTQINYTLATLIGISPQDELEGMLAAQMIACHNASMECFRRAMLKEQTIEGRSMNLGQANKLTRSYSILMEALNKHRGKGQQKVTVEHVHVHEGGQAIVGSVEGNLGQKLF